MAIVINDWFEVSASGPIDDRLVKDNISARDAIVKKYVGLKVYVKSEDKTYVYTSANQWKLDGGGSSFFNRNDGNWTENIFASGSLASDFELFLGTVSNSKDDRSYYSTIWSRGLTDKDEVRISNSTYRSTNGSDYDSMSHRLEQQYRINGNTPVMGPSIDFNVGDPSGTQQKGVVPLGLLINIPTNNTTRKPKIGLLNIDNQSSTNLYLDGLDIPSFKFEQGVTLLTQPEAVFDINFGYNLDEVATLPGYRMKFLGAMGNMDGGFVSLEGEGTLEDGSIPAKLQFQTKVANESVWNTAMEIDNRYINTTEQKYPGIGHWMPSSPVRFSVDDSSNYWDSISPKNFGLYSFPEIVRKLEHRYESIQMLNQSYNYKFENNTLYINPVGNSFHIVLRRSPQVKISDIRPLTFSRADHLGNAPVDQPGQAIWGFGRPTEFPVGTVINIKFDSTYVAGDMYQNATGQFIMSIPFQFQNYIDVSTFSNIRSNISNSTFQGLTDRITIFHERKESGANLGEFIQLPDGSYFNNYTANQLGDYFTFIRKQDGAKKYWEIVKMNRLSFLPKRGWYVDHFGNGITDPELLIPGELEFPYGPFDQRERYYYWEFNQFKYCTAEEFLLTRGSSTRLLWREIQLQIVPTAKVSRFVEDDCFQEEVKSKDLWDEKFPQFYYPGYWTFRSSNQQNGTERGNIYDKRLQFSIDGNRIVHVRGTIIIRTKNGNGVTPIKNYIRYKSTGYTNNGLFFLSDADIFPKQKNIWKIGSIRTDSRFGEPILLPKFDTAWNFVDMFGFAYNQNYNKVGITFSNSILSINSQGWIILEFDAIPGDVSITENCINPYMEIYVPEFSYIAYGPTQTSPVA